jgi:hypothetical protein
MTPITNATVVDKVISLFNLHGTSLIKVNVTRSEMSAICNSGDDRIATYFPKLKEARELLLRTIKAEKTVLRAELDTKSQAYFDAVDKLDIRERDFKLEVPNEILASVPIILPDLSTRRHSVKLRVSMTG